VEVTVVVLEHVVVPREPLVATCERTGVGFFSGVLAHVALQVLRTLKTLLAKLTRVLVLLLLRLLLTLTLLLWLVQLWGCGARGRGG